MFPDYKGKLLFVIWMGVGSAVLTSIFSSIIITYLLKIHNKLNERKSTKS